MIKNVKISSVSQLQTLQLTASKSIEDIGVHDSRGTIADARSMLGLFMLDYSEPVHIVCENERELKRVCRCLAQ